MGTEEAIIAYVVQLLKKAYHGLRAVSAVKGELKDLKQPLTSLLAMAEGLQMMDYPTPDMLEWARAAFDIGSDFEDSVFLLDCLKDSFPRQLSAKVRLVSPVKGMKSQIQKMLDTYVENRWDELCPLANHSYMDVPTIKWQRNKLLGLDHTVHHLANLMGSRGVQGPLRVISVVGDGGCGKTAAAVEAMILVRSEFDISATAVARDDNQKMMLSDLWMQLTNEKCPLNESTDFLHWKCRQILQNKRFLILVDDLWNQRSWEGWFSGLFPEHCNGSVVLVTTRQHSLGVSCSSSPEFVVEVHPLNDSASRHLFMQELSRGHDVSSLNSFESYLKRILGKCGGNPLAILACASHIRGLGATYLDVWKDLASSLTWVPESSDQLYDLMLTLRLSFKRLPLHLKRCALLLVGFPDSRPIDADLLVSAWISEGFVVTTQPSDDAFLTARKYMLNLLSHRILEAVQVTPGGQVTRVKVPRLMHNMLSGIAHMNGFYGVSSPAPVSISQLKLRRLSIVCDESDGLALQSSNLSTKATRVVILHGCRMWPLLSKFRFLRVLIVDSCWRFDNEDLQEVMKLVYLKVLAVHGPAVTTVPQQIGDLSRLVGLFLYDTRVRGLPCSYSNLKAITCIKVGDVAFPRGLSQLVMLQFLEVLNIGSSEVDALQELGELRKLKVLACSWYLDEIEGKEVFYVFKESLKVLLTQGSIEELKLCGDSGSLRYLSMSSFGQCKHLQKLWLDGPTYMPKLSLSVVGMKRLKDVRISLGAVTAADCTVLGSFPVLTSLQIWVDKNVAAALKFSDGLFLKLEQLILAAGSLSVSFDPGCLPKVETMYIVCTSLELVGFEHAEAVKKLSLCPHGGGAEGARTTAEQALASHPANPVLVVVPFVKHAEVELITETPKTIMKIESEDEQLKKLTAENFE